ncbi:MAG TPA: type II 3-dehydroquinate dehydratase [Gemmatimonadales bacterium]|nr:type II 3-dehydroquinate dehydratase [Gemmatimonadales bacterium]
MLIAVLNGPNLNLVGTREPEIYGRTAFADVERLIRREAAELGVDVDWMQTNHEGELVEAVQRLAGRADGAVVNAAAFTHTSLALRDAFLAVRVPFVECHLSNLFARNEPDRHRSLLGDLALGVVTGFGAQSYPLALRALVGRLRAA